MRTDHLHLTETEHKLEQLEFANDFIVLWLWIPEQSFHMHHDNNIPKWLFRHSLESIPAVTNTDNGVYNKPTTISITASLLVE